jgi:hypothetical protein
MAEQVKNPSLYRALHRLKKGKLREYLHVPEGENIPAEKLEKAKNSKNRHVSRMAHLAATMKTWKH